MISAVTSSPSVGTEAARRGGENFSYAMAAAKTRENAAQALKAHGGAPSAAQTTSASPPRAQATDKAAAQSVARAADASPSQRPQEAAPAQAQTAAKTAAPGGPPSGGANVAIASIAHAPTAALARTAALQNGALALKEPAAAKTARAATAPAPAPAPQRLATEEFARILAERLADQTRFDIDLSAEGLGRIEGRLILGDDGAASLALAFDRPETLDQFLRDGEALRAHLEASGFEFKERDIRLALRDSARDDAAPHADPAEAPRRLIAGGAIDILI